VRKQTSSNSQILCHILITAGVLWELANFELDSLFLKLVVLGHLLYIFDTNYKILNNINNIIGMCDK